MFITPAYAQTAPSGVGDVTSLIILILLVALIVFLVVSYRRGKAIRLDEEARGAGTGVSSPRVSQKAAFAKAPEPAPSLRNVVFLSYRRNDSIDVTGRLYDKLVADLGKNAVFKDIDSIPLGSDFREHIDESLRNCKVFLLIMGRNWKGEQTAPGAHRIDDRRDFIRIEVETALGRGIPVVPVLVHDAEMPPEDSLPPAMQGIAYRQAIRVRADPDFHRDADRIVSFLKAHLRLD